MNRPALIAIVFLIATLALAGAAHAIPGNATVATITITKPENNENIGLPTTHQKHEANINFTYTVGSDNNITWCRLMANGSQLRINQTIERSIDQYFHGIGLTNGTWWYYIQCRDNYTNLYNSSNNTLRIILDDTLPVVNINTALTTYNRTDGRTNFKFNVTDMETAISNCTLFVDGIEKSAITSVGNGSTAGFPEIVLPEGDYTWQVMCQDKAGNIGKSPHGVLDTSEWILEETIVLNSPIDDARDFDGYVSFSYTPYSRYKINWCVIKFNNSYNVTNSSIKNRTVNTFENMYLDHGPYNWSIMCMDELGNNLSSGYYDLWINRTVLMSDYLTITVAAPEDYFISELGNVNFRYTPTATLGLARCELVTNDSTREVKEAPVSGSETAFAEVELSEGEWEWRIRCFDKSGNEFNSPKRTLTVKPIAPEPIPDKPDVPISGTIEEKNVTDLIEAITGAAKSAGMSNATWITIVVITILASTFIVVVIVDKRFELELKKDVQLMLYKMHLRKDAPEAKKKQVLTEGHKKALKDYIVYHMRNGVTRQKIEEHLRAYKWSEDHIRQVFDELEAEWESWRQKYAEKI